MPAILLATSSFSQTDTAAFAGVFQRIAKNVEHYKPDTSAAPDDKSTQLIKELRALRGGFNINEAIEYKLQEEKQDKKMSDSAYNILSAFFKNGNGKRWLDNAVIWIYRQSFTHQELKTLVKFYKTSAGQKFAADFPLILIKSAMAADMIQKNVPK